MPLATRTLSGTRLARCGRPGEWPMSLEPSVGPSAIPQPVQESRHLTDAAVPDDAFVLLLEAVPGVEWNLGDG